MQNRYSLVNDVTKRKKKMAVREEEVVRPHVCAPKLVVRMVTVPQLCGARGTIT